jgi:hypothetical protein
MEADPRSGPPLLKPLPRRPFSTSGSASPQPPTPAQLLTPDAAVAQDPYFASSTPSDPSTDGANPRSRSFLNLTASTLFGIYAPTALTPGGGETDTPSTPWDAGAETPARKDSLDQWGAAESPASPTSPTAALWAITGGGRSPARRGAPINGDELERRLLRGRRTASNAGTIPPARAAAPEPSSSSAPAAAAVVGPSELAVRALALFAVGVLYGALVAHLHDGHAGAGLGSLRERVAALAAAGWWRRWPEAREVGYLGAWGAAGVMMGTLLPWVDGWLRARYGGEGQMGEARGAAWLDVVRSVGAFVGIAFAIVSFFGSILKVALTRIAPPPLGNDAAAVSDAGSDQPFPLVPR